MKTRSNRVPMLVLAAASLLLSGCMDQREVVAPEVSVSTAVASAAPSFPNATYAVTLLPEDFPPFFPPEIVELLTGDWELDFTDPRVSVARLNGEVVVESRYTSNPARLVLRDLGGNLACVEPGTAQGVYGWSLDDGELSLTVVQDRCDGRPFVLTAKPWTMQ
jgi:hypothetical protein